METSPFREAIICLDGQEITFLLRKSNLTPCLQHRATVPHSVPDDSNPILTSRFCRTYFEFTSPLLLDLPSYFFHSVVASQILTSPTWPLLFSLILSDVLGKGHRLCRSLSCIFFRLFCHFYFVSKIVLLSILSTNAFNLFSSLNLVRQVSHPYKGNTGCST